MSRTYSPTTQACQCEHVAHETPNEAVHPYLGTPAGGSVSVFVGAVCDDCAVDHLRECLIVASAGAFERIYGPEQPLGGQS